MRRWFPLLLVAASPLFATPPIGPHIVFFDSNSAGITSRAVETLDFAAAIFRQVGAKQMTLHAHSSLSGSADYNLELSKRRGEAVRAYLIGRGVPEAAVRVEAYGENNPLVPNETPLAEPQNRRVVIQVQMEADTSGS